MNQELKQISCDDQCGFMVRSHDEKEVMDMARIHIKTQHKMNATDADLKAKMTTVQQTAGARR